MQIENLSAFRTGRLVAAPFMGAKKQNAGIKPAATDKEKQNAGIKPMPTDKNFVEGLKYKKKEGVCVNLQL